MLLSIATQQIIAQSKSEKPIIKPVILSQESRYKFFYTEIQNKVSLKFEFKDERQIEYVTINFDSIMQVIKNDIKYLADSIKYDGIPRKIIYWVNAKHNRIQIESHTEPENTFYIVKDKELQILKQVKDTLQIRINAGEFIFEKNHNTSASLNLPFNIYLISNNLLEIQNLKNGLIDTCFNDMKQHLFNKMPKTKDRFDRYFGFHKMKQKEFENLFNNCNWSILKKGKKKTFDAAFAFGFQNTNATWLSSFNLGARLISTSLYNDETHWNLGFDNYFHFYNDANNHFNRDTYSFLTLRLFQKDREQQKKNGFQFIPGYSFGYLINRGGNLFEKNTMKMSFPFVSSGLLHIEPEIFFNDFFKNTTLSLKLSINYE